MGEEALKPFDQRFHVLCEADRQRSVPPARLLRAPLIPLLDAEGNPRMRMEQPGFDLLSPRSKRQKRLGPVMARAAG